MKRVPSATYGFDVSSGVKVNVTAHAPILNENDPDVRFGYIFCGSMGGEAETAAAFRRAEQKVQFGAIPSRDECWTHLKPFAPICHLLSDGKPIKATVEDDYLRLPSRVIRGDGWSCTVHVGPDGVGTDFVGAGLRTSKRWARAKATAKAIANWATMKARAANRAAKAMRAGGFMPDEDEDY